MIFTRTAEQRRSHQLIGMRAEEVASWYFRLNGFLSLPGFVVHLDQDKAEVGADGIPRYQRTEADLIAVRFIESREIINSFGAKREMHDDQKLLDLYCSGENKQALFIVVEVTSGLCKMNGPWTNSNKKNMQRVIRRLGFATSESNIEKIAEAMYRSGRYEDDFYAMQYICLGNEKNPEIGYSHRDVLQIEWNEIGEFFIRRFKDFPEKTPDGQVHEQWPDFGKKLGKFIATKIRSGEAASLHPSIVRRFIQSGAFS